MSAKANGSVATLCVTELGSTRKVVGAAVVTGCIVLQSWLSCAVAAPRQHDGGLFARATIGAGPASSESGSIEFSGSGVDIDFALGGIVTRNLAVHATVFGWLISDPEVSDAGTTLGSVNADLDMSALGAGLTWYIGESNAYLSSSVGVARLTATSGNTSIESESGLAFEVLGGKEWYVSDTWGLGAVVGAGFHSIPDEGSENLQGWNLSLRFSVTRN